MQPELLPGLRARRDPQPRRAAKRRHVDLRAERRLVNRQRDDDVQVVAFAAERGMRLHVDRDVEVAVLAAVSSDVALGRDANARAVGEAGRNRDIQMLAARLDLLAVARRALHYALASRSVAGAARACEDHMPARRLHHARALALAAARFLRLHPAGPSARAAMLLPRDGQRSRAARNRLFEGEIERLVKIRAAEGRAVARVTLAPLIDDVGEEIAERRRRRTADGNGEVEALEAVGCRLGLCGLADRVVAAPAIGIAQRLVRFGDLAELRGGHPVTGIDVRMKPPRKTLVGALDVGNCRAFFEAQNNVEIH